MLGSIDEAQRGLLWMAIILCVGFTAFLCFGVVPLVKAIRELVNKVDSLKKTEEGEGKAPQNPLKLTK